MDNERLCIFTDNAETILLVSSDRREGMETTEVKEPLVQEVTWSK